jgi:signal transduction histidine kinase
MVTLRRVTTDIIAEEGLLPEGSGSNALRLMALMEPATNASIKSYVESRDLATRRAHAEQVGSLVHELRNPLGAATLAARRLQDPSLPTADRQRLLDLLERYLDRTRRMVDEALLTEQLQADSVKTQPLETAIGELIGEALEVHRHAAHEKGLRFTAQLDPGMPICADPHLTLSALVTCSAMPSSSPTRARSNCESNIATASW